MLRNPADPRSSSIPPPQAQPPSSGVKLVDDDESPLLIKATQKMGVPESVRLLRIAVPTPMQPIMPVLPVSAATVRTRPFGAPPVRSNIEEARNAVLLFFVLLGGCMVAAGFVVLALFP